MVRFFVEVLVLYAKKVKEVKDISVDLSKKEILVECNQTLEQTSIEKKEIVYQSTRRLSKHKQPNQIREALKKGYVEMSQINLSICRECLHAEFEAQHTIERLVSGG